MQAKHIPRGGGGGRGERERRRKYNASWTQACHSLHHDQPTRPRITNVTRLSYRETKARAPAHHDCDAAFTSSEKSRATPGELPSAAPRRAAVETNKRNSTVEYKSSSSALGAAGERARSLRGKKTKRKTDKKRRMNTTKTTVQNAELSSRRSKCARCSNWGWCGPRTTFGASSPAGRRQGIIPVGRLRKRGMTQARDAERRPCAHKLCTVAKKRGAPCRLRPTAATGLTFAPPPINDNATRRHGPAH